MRFAIIIVTYTPVEQTLRMVKALNNGQFDFYIHVDKKLDIETHRALFNISNVYFVKDRIDIKWAGYSTVKAALSSLRDIVKSGIKYDFVNLLTGQDYPLKSASYISAFFQNNIGKEFILYRDFDIDWNEAQARVDRYHFTDLRFKGRHKLEKLINLITFRRHFPIKGMHLYGKETFWTLSLDCAKYVLDFIDQNKKLRRFLKYSWGTDEFIFQTIIMDSPYKLNVVNKNYRYIDWPSGSARPKTLTAEDFDKMISSDCLFGRKFDINKDVSVLDMLDKVNAN